MWPRSGKRKEDADANSGKLDKALTKLSGIIGNALASWGADGDMPDAVEIERAGGFTVVQKAKIAAEYLAQKKSRGTKSKDGASPRRGLETSSDQCGRQHRPAARGVVE